MTRDDHRALGVASALAREVSPFILKATPLLRSGPFCLWGEIVTLERGHSATFLTLLDAEDSSMSLEARLATDTTSLAVGDMIGLWGRLVPTKPDLSTIEVVFSAERLHDSKGPSRRQRQRRQVVAEYGPKRRQPLPRRAPRRIALVTSERSRAVGDFNRALIGAGSAEVRVDLFHVDLNDPSSIVRGIHDARGSRPDVIVLTRGGGDGVALLPFREPTVIEAVGVVTASTPVIIAVGHAADRIEVDEVATASVSTPTAAGNLVATLLLRTPRRSWRRTAWIIFLLLLVLFGAWAYRAWHRPRGPHAELVKETGTRRRSRPSDQPRKDDEAPPSRSPSPPLGPGGDALP